MGDKENNSYSMHQQKVQTSANCAVNMVSVERLGTSGSTELSWVFRFVTKAEDRTSNLLKQPTTLNKKLSSFVYSTLPGVARRSGLL